MKVTASISLELGTALVYQSPRVDGLSEVTRFISLCAERIKLHLCFPHSVHSYVGLRYPTAQLSSICEGVAGQGGES